MMKTWSGEIGGLLNDEDRKEVEEKEVVEE